jgi:hypothetical protein
VQGPTRHARHPRGPPSVSGSSRAGTNTVTRLSGARGGRHSGSASGQAGCPVRPHEAAAVATDRRGRADLAVLLLRAIPATACNRGTCSDCSYALSQVSRQTTIWVPSCLLRGQGSASVWRGRDACLSKPPTRRVPQPHLHCLICTRRVGLTTPSLNKSSIAASKMCSSNSGHRLHDRAQRRHVTPWIVVFIFATIAGFLPTPAF